MKINTVGSQNFNGSVVRGYLGSEQAKVFNSVMGELAWRMRNRNYDLVVAQERKWPNANFNRHVTMSLYNPYSTPQKVTDKIEIYMHNAEKWLEKFDELINRNN